MSSLRRLLKPHMYISSHSGPCPSTDMCPQDSCSTGNCHDMQYSSPCTGAHGMASAAMICIEGLRLLYHKPGHSHASTNPKHSPQCPAILPRGKQCQHLIDPNLSQRTAVLQCTTGRLLKLCCRKCMMHTHRAAGCWGSLRVLPAALLSCQYQLCHGVCHEQ
jgi:hypothetical protein